MTLSIYQLMLLLCSSGARHHRAAAAVDIVRYNFYHFFLAEEFKLSEILIHVALEVRLGSKARAPVLRALHPQVVSDTCLSQAGR